MQKKSDIELKEIHKRNLEEMMKVKTDRLSKSSKSSKSNKKVSVSKKVNVNKKVNVGKKESRKKNSLKEAIKIIFGKF